MENNKYICRVCGKEIIYQGRQLYRRKHSQLGTNICFDCAKENAKLKISEKVKDNWKDPSYRNKVIEKQKELVNRNLKEDSDYYKNLSMKFWNGSESKIKETMFKRSEGLKKYYAELTENDIKDALKMEQIK